MKRVVGCTVLLLASRVSLAQAQEMPAPPLNTGTDSASDVCRWTSTLYFDK
jgi:hypothetical protein